MKTLTTESSAHLLTSNECLVKWLKCNDVCVCVYTIAEETFIPIAILSLMALNQLLRDSQIITTENMLDPYSFPYQSSTPDKNQKKS